MPDTEERTAGFVPKEVKEIQDFKYREEAKAKVMKAGLIFPAQPNIPDELMDGTGHIQLPSDLTAVSDDELGMYLTIFTGLSAYGTAVVANADIDWTVAERIATFAERYEIIKLPKDSQKNDDLRYGSVHRLGYVRELRKDELEKQATFKMATAMVAGYEKMSNAVSREITRRANTFRAEGRESSYGRSLYGE